MGRRISAENLDSLRYALSDITEELMKGGEVQAIIKQVSDEYGLDSRLIHRKFREEYEVNPDKYVEVRYRRQRNVEKADALLVERARRAARDFNLERYSSGTPAEVGRIFQFRGELYVFAGTRHVGGVS